MAFNFSPKIITDDLVLYLDAANRKSYPGSGTVWNDLSGNGNTGTLINGPTFNSSNGGSIVFDGINDYGRINNFSSDDGAGLSVCGWVNPVTLSVDQFAGVFLNWIINKRNTTTPNTNSWQFITANSKLTFSAWGVANTVITPDNQTQGIYTLQLNKWQYVSACIGKNTGSEFSTYYNGHLNFSGSMSGDLGNSTKSVDVGKTGWADGYYWNGRISNIKIYNRTLSAQEIQQNYNATRQRFGV
jgi:hypothetical protein